MSFFCFYHSQIPVTFNKDFTDGLFGDHLIIHFSTHPEEENFMLKTLGSLLSCCELEEI